MRLGKPIILAGKTWGIMPNSTRWFDGLGVMDALGTTFLVQPFGDDSCGQVLVKELDGLTPVTAKAGNRFVSVITVDKQGVYQKVEFTFDPEYKTYNVWQGGADAPPS